MRESVEDVIEFKDRKVDVYRSGNNTTEDLEGAVKKEESKEYSNNNTGNKSSNHNTENNGNIEISNLGGNWKKY